MKKVVSLFLALAMCGCKFVTLPFGRSIVEARLTPIANATVETPAPEHQSSVEYIKSCLQIEKRLPEENMFQGHIITTANDSYELVVFPSDEHFSNEMGNIYGDAILGISPDGQWLVYELVDTPEDFITIKGFSWITDARWTTDIPLVSREVSHWAHWLDSERLLFDFYLDNPIIVNMFTGEAEQIDVKHPEFYIEGGHAPLLSRYLNRMVAYRNFPEEPPSIVLWDLPNKSKIWQIYINTEITLRNLAQISPDGEQIAISGSLEPFVDPIFLDLFLLEWDGTAKQLTTLRDAGLITSLIEQLQWSPDGRYLAFWLNGSLAVYDTATQMITDYCIQSSNSMSFAPYWSPNSQQVAFNGDVTLPGSGPIIIVDIINGSAVEITENGYYIEGWMSDMR